MDLEKYYVQKDGGYLIHFVNNDKLTLNEIREKFSSYGNVISVSNRGQVNGLVFIIYENLDDTLNAIRNSLVDKAIHLLRHKTKGITKREDWTLSVQKTGFENNYSNTDANKFKRNSTANNESTCDTSNKNMYANNETIRLHESTKLRQVISNSSISPWTANDHTKEIPEFDKTKIPALICDDKKDELQSTCLSKGATIMLAHEIIVANIPFNVNVHYILHLFDKYNPISVSFIKTVPEIGIRYCHVYYETQEQADATMKEFDKYLLFESKLIVLTPCHLRNEAS